MDNNMLEMMMKLMSGGFSQSQNFTQSNFTTYPQDLGKNQESNAQFQSNNQFQENNQNQGLNQMQNNLIPMLLSLLNKSQTANIFSSDKNNDNKKAEVSTSALNDEILL